MWVFNYTIKCTIRHNYQCSEPETAHNRRVIYCSLCLYYSLMMPGCLHTAPLPWRRACRHHAKLTNSALVLGPWILSKASAASSGVEGRSGGPGRQVSAPCPLTFLAGTRQPWSHQEAPEEGRSRPPPQSPRAMTRMDLVLWEVASLSTQASRTPGEPKCGQEPCLTWFPDRPSSAQSWLCDLGQVLAPPGDSVFPICERTSGSHVVSSRGFTELLGPASSCGDSGIWAVHLSRPLHGGHKCPCSTGADSEAQSPYSRQQQGRETNPSPPLSPRAVWLPDGPTSRQPHNSPRAGAISFHRQGLGGSEN